MGSTFVYAALAFDELGESLSIGLKPVGELKCSRPLIPRLCIHYARVRRTKNGDGKWLLYSDRARVGLDKAFAS